VVDRLDISQTKIGEVSQRVIDRAVDEARRREHPLLTNEHMFLAFAYVARNVFTAAMRGIELNSHAIVQAIDERLLMAPSLVGRELPISPAPSELRAESSGTADPAKDAFFPRRQPGPSSLAQRTE
jgi:ATP-dependent Clp protease ATP-binding subunit ClpA